MTQKEHTKQNTSELSSTCVQIAQNLKVCLPRLFGKTMKNCKKNMDSWRDLLPSHLQHKATITTTTCHFFLFVAVDWV